MYSEKRGHAKARELGDILIPCVQALFRLRHHSLQNNLKLYLSIQNSQVYCLPQLGKAGRASPGLKSIPFTFPLPVLFCPGGAKWEHPILLPKLHPHSCPPLCTKIKHNSGVAQSWEDEWGKRPSHVLSSLRQFGHGIHGTWNSLEGRIGTGHDLSGET